MQQKTYDFLLNLKVPMATFGAELLGDAIELVMNEIRVHRFISLAEIESSLADKFNCSVGSADRRMRRALEVTEFRTGNYPNKNLQMLKDRYGIDTLSIKKFLYAAGRELMNDRG